MKEKIILGNKVELSYDSIGFGAGTLAISFKAGDMAALEKSFRDSSATRKVMYRRHTNAMTSLEKSERQLVQLRRRMLLRSFWSRRA